MKANTVTDETFQAEVLDASQPVLVDFWAEWCGPCRVISPALEQIAEELGDRLTVAKVNVDENPHSPLHYGVRSIPALIIFRNGKPAASKIGAAPKSELKHWVEATLAEAV